MFAYSNNGLSFRAVDPDYEAQNGEVIFPAYATPAQLTSAFNGYVAAAAAQDALVGAYNAMNEGIIITSTATGSLNGTYPVDSVSQANINGIISYILVNNSFPAGASQLPWYDIDGEAHAFTSVDQFKSFATAVADYVAALSIYSSSGGKSGALPSNAVTIP